MATSKRIGIKSSAQDNFLSPLDVTGLTVTDVGVGRAYNDGSFTVSWTLPANSPAATSYDVTTNPATTTVNVTTTSATLTGLASSGQYTVTVVAKNASGSSAGTTSGTVTATTKPAQPSAPTAATVANTAQDTVTWSAPNNGGKPITNYHWTSSDGKSGDTTSTSVTVGQEAGTAQTYNVYATNDNGNSDPSQNSANVTTFSFTPFSFTPFSFTPYSFTPYSFVPYSFTPYSFVPYSFVPYSFVPYSFVPYSFTPYSFTPYSFTPTAYSFTPLRYCIDQDTPVAVVSEDGMIGYKPASDIRVGDNVWSITWDGMVDELIDPLAKISYKSLDSHQRVKTSVIAIEESSKSSTVILNDNLDMRFTMGEKVLTQVGDVVSFVEIQDLKVGDRVFHANEVEVAGIAVTSIEVIDQARTVYKFNVSPVDTLIAGGIIVHNGKV
jgi:hypothetical protein